MQVPKADCIQPWLWRMAQGCSPQPSAYLVRCGVTLLVRISALALHAGQTHLVKAL